MTCEIVTFGLHLSENNHLFLVEYAGSLKLTTEFKYIFTPRKTKVLKDYPKVSCDSSSI